MSLSNSSTVQREACKRVWHVSGWQSLRSNIRTMLFLLFQLGKDRYALESSRVVEVLPYVQIKAVPDAPRGVAGLIAYRGQAVPVVDLSMLILGVPAPALLSTRIIVTQSRDRTGQIRI